MVKLASGDLIQFDINSRGKPVLRVIGCDDVPRIEKEGCGWNDGDTVVLTGSELALFLHRLWEASPSTCCVTAGGSGLSKLLVSTRTDELGELVFVLETDVNTIHMKVYERDMLMSAIKSRVWKLFT
jgi:hypothetical protein